MGNYKHTYRGEAAGAGRWLGGTLDLAFSFLLGGY
jgi:hypothetical protein